MNKILLPLFFLYCTLCSSQLAFQENASLAGVGEGYGISYLGGGLSFCDFDGDGWDDITFATEKNRETLFFKNTAGTFAKVDLGINDTYETKQVLWVDYDNDGDKDFFATSITGLNKLYKNNGDMTFVDVSDSCGLFTENLFTYGATFGDIDNDGDLDVFITNRDVTTKFQHNYLYRNDNGFYVDITISSGIVIENGLSFCASFLDYDKDGYQDIYVANDKPSKINRLYKNNGDNSFKDVSVSSGAGLFIDAMSTTIGDYNNDGWFDIYVTNTFGGNYHLRNNKDGTFTNVAPELGTAFYSIGWGAVFLDADNDADLDLYVSGMLDGTTDKLSAAFYENLDGSYEIPVNAGFEDDKRVSFSNAMGDTDNDGFPEIVVMNDTVNNFLWKNKTVNTNNWLKVKLLGTLSNKDGIGSTIEVFAGGKSQYRYTVCGEGYLGQNSSYEFFGLKDAARIDYIKVSWLSGVVDMVSDAEVNQMMTIVEGSAPVIEVIEDTPDTTDTNDALLDCLGQDLLLFPNPSSDGIVTICTDFQEQVLTVEVYDLLGNKITTQQVSAAFPSLSLTELSRGLYIVRLSGNGSVVFKKLLKL